MNPTDEYLCNLARAYVLEDYAQQGERVYFWEEWDNPEDDRTARVACGYLPPSEGYYQWSEVYSCEVETCEVIERNEESQEFTVRVDAQIAIAHSFDEEAEIPQPEHREIFCYVEYDRDSHQFYIDNADE